MIALMLSGFGLTAQAPCATIDQHDAGWALVRLQDGRLTELPFPLLDDLRLEGARLCPAGLQPPPQRRRSARSLPSPHLTLEELSL